VNWLGYPGSRVIGGYLVGYSASGDRCVALCRLHESCLAVDFNTVDGGCWVHSTPDNKCAAPVPTNHVYHAKKPPACGTIRYETVAPPAGGGGSFPPMGGRPKIM